MTAFGRSFVVYIAFPDLGGPAGSNSDAIRRLVELGLKAMEKP
jgi:hypothetical protein